MHATNKIRLVAGGKTKIKIFFAFLSEIKEKLKMPPHSNLQLRIIGIIKLFKSS
jgi:hypothetical protein